MIRQASINKACILRRMVLLHFVGNPTAAVFVAAQNRWSAAWQIQQNSLYAFQRLTSSLSEELSTKTVFMGTAKTSLTGSMHMLIRVFAKRWFRRFVHSVACIELEKCLWGFQTVTVTYSNKQNYKWIPFAVFYIVMKSMKSTKVHCHLCQYNSEQTFPIKGQMDIYILLSCSLCTRVDMAIHQRHFLSNALISLLSRRVL